MVWQKWVGGIEGFGLNPTYPLSELTRVDCSAITIPLTCESNTVTHKTCQIGSVGTSNSLIDSNCVMSHASSSGIACVPSH